MTIKQEDMTISQHFMKIKSLCHEIAQLDPNSKIPEVRMRQIIIIGLRLDYQRYTTGIRSWQTQCTILELEALLVAQETLIK